MQPDMALTAQPGNHKRFAIILVVHFFSRFSAFTLATLNHATPEIGIRIRSCISALSLFRR